MFRATLHWLALGALLVPSLIGVADAQNPYHLYCIVVWGGDQQAAPVRLPAGSPPSDCTIIAQAMEQQPPRIPSIKYELGCQKGGLFMVTIPRPWDEKPRGSDFSQVAPTVPKTEIDACADAWHIPP